ncbi:u1 zinc finger protein [Cystoisospora suis]|uniref:U1 zinc finger protein n=1 Tax=Cystoisospora suis TaxID=483139 RepID=A0A2C6L7Z8_9APIC|nr:u1 zinc finger protein [Cystoisospora suis]
MTERWVSQKRHYCEVCRTWLSGHIMNVKRHEMSERHIANMRQMFKDMRNREKERLVSEEFQQKEISRIEAAAAAAMRRGDSSSSSSSSFHSSVSSSSSSSFPQPSSSSFGVNAFGGGGGGGSEAERSREVKASWGVWHMLIDDASKLPYFYNSQTHQSSWVPPPGFPLPHPSSLLPSSSSSLSSSFSPSFSSSSVSQPSAQGEGRELEERKPKLRILSIKKKEKKSEEEVKKEESSVSSSNTSTTSSSSLLPPVKREEEERNDSSLLQSNPMSSLSSTPSEADAKNVRDVSTDEIKKEEKKEEEEERKTRPSVCGLTTSSSSSSSIQETKPHNLGVGGRLSLSPKVEANENRGTEREKDLLSQHDHPLSSVKKEEMKDPDLLLATSSSSSLSSSSSVSSSSSSVSSSSSLSCSFFPSAVFLGKREGYVFQSGVQGVGYYIDTPPLASSMLLNRSSREGENNARTYNEDRSDLREIRNEEGDRRRSSNETRGMRGRGGGGGGRRGWRGGSRATRDEWRKKFMKTLESPVAQEQQEEEEEENEDDKTGEEEKEKKGQEESEEEKRRKAIEKASIGPSIGEWEEVQPGDYSAFGSSSSRVEEEEQEEEEDLPQTETEYLRDLRWDVACQKKIYRDDLQPIEKPTYQHSSRGLHDKDEEEDEKSSSPPVFRHVKRFKNSRVLRKPDGD